MSNIPNVPALPVTNPGRPGWNIAAEAASLADAGSAGLAGSILRIGFLASKPVSVSKNREGASLAILFAGILQGLDSRKDKEGNPKPLALAAGPPAEDGQPGPAKKVTIDQVRVIIDAIHPEEQIPAYAIPDGGDGRRRTVAYAMAWIYAKTIGSDLNELSVVGGASDDGTDALRGNFADQYRRALGPWQKVQAACELMRKRPAISETDLRTATGCSRGDSQLMHRAAVAMLRHGLTADWSKRCPGKEEWPDIRDTEDADEAQAMLDKLQDAKRPKVLGVDQWSAALARMPADTKLDARELAKAMEQGTEEAMSAYLIPFMPD